MACRSFPRRHPGLRQRRETAKRILIYGFGPYRNFQDNVTEKIVRRLPRRRWLHRMIFPVRFASRPFIDALRKVRPDFILGLGQCSRGRRLRIEVAAANKRRNNRAEKPRPIVPNGALRLSTNLKLDLGRRARASHNAGDYVCNYSMYVILDFLRKRRRPTRFAFVHVPCRYDPGLATRLLMAALTAFSASGERRARGGR
jgi:pyrrolidone-carboxylate peptidase